MKRIKRSYEWFLALLITVAFTSFGQQSKDRKLDKMPVDLETEFALSALPAHLRDQATVYLLDPEKGYYIARQGTNGFSAFVCRTEWEWADFESDTYAAISYDAEGTKAYMPSFLDVAEMRASGKYSPSQVKERIVKRVKDGTYKAPSRAGISYMLGPMMRSHPGTKEIVNMIMPHYMLYAPNVDNADIGGTFGTHDPFVIGDDGTLGKGHAIFNYIILPVGEMEKARIIDENKDLLRRLAEYKPYLKVEPGASHH